MCSPPSLVHYLCTSSEELTVALSVVVVEVVVEVVITLLLSVNNPLLDKNLQNTVGPA